MTAESCEVFHCRDQRSWVITILSCLILLAGFEVSLIGRFSGVPRGRGLNGWPRSWMGLEKNIPPGERLIALFRPFLEYLAAS
jgi:hypothetical protein